MKLFVLLGIASMALASPHNKMDNSRIVGGTTVTAGDMNFTASVEIGNLLGLFGYTFQCGGVIFNENTILTAASCVEDLPLLALTRVRVGSLQTEQGGSTYQVSKIILHPDRASFGNNNLAILKLFTNITMNLQTSSIPLYYTDTFTGKNVYVSGWANSVDLKVIKMSVPGWGWCSNNILPGEFFSDMFCAGGDGIGSCEKDLGGPAAVSEAGVYKLVGIVAYPNKCYNMAYPQTYLNLVRYKDWINANI